MAKTLDQSDPTAGDPAQPAADAQAHTDGAKKAKAPKKPKAPKEPKAPKAPKKAKKPAKKSKLDLADLPPQPDPHAPLDAAFLIKALQPLRKSLEADLSQRIAASPELQRALRERHAADKKAERTADPLVTWQRSLVEQVAAAWILSCVFVRTLEDRGLLLQCRIAGPGAMDAQRTFLALAPSLSEREYLLTTFREMTRLPAAAELFDTHDPVWMLAPSAEGAKALLQFFRAGGGDAPALRFGQPDTRFLGDLYQDLNENVRKRYALLQTPDFVEAFILDRTLTPAIAKFGLDDTKLIDPTCGSGHFLLGAFDRLFDQVRASKPALSTLEAAEEALRKVHGADINPYAVAIAKFRLTLSFLDKVGYSRIADAPKLPLHVAVADSLLYNPQHEQRSLFHQEGVQAAAWEQRAFDFEDEREARAVLHGEYAAVVGNPPYITPPDAALARRYAKMYSAAYRKYSLSVPFCQRFFELARKGGRVGQITANSFMKREFGKKLIEEYLPSVNLDLIVNASGAYIPGHGTPTVVLFGSHEKPTRAEVPAVLSKRGEPATPDDPAQGLVWTSIVTHLDEIGFDNEFISVALVDRAKLEKHPWSLAGGGAEGLKQEIEDRAAERLADRVESIGVDAITRASDLLELEPDQYRRLGVESHTLLPYLVGEEIRDWGALPRTQILVPYDRVTWELAKSLDSTPGLARFLWPHRGWLGERWVSGGTRLSDVGLPFWTIPQLPVAKHKTPLAITFAFVATHNHFVLDRGGNVFKQSAPIIKLPETATEEDHLALLAYLNSSTAGFLLRQVCHSKGAQGVNEGHKSEEWEQFLEYSGTMVGKLPLPPDLASLAPLGRALSEADIHTDLDRMVMLQETLDWKVYRLFGLVEDDVLLVDDTQVRVGSRPFERRLLESTPTTAWFERNHYPRPDLEAEPSPITAARLSAIDASPMLDLLERPEFKRRWTLPPSPAERERARAREDLLAAVENTLREAGTAQPVGLRGTGPVHATEITGTELADLIQADAVPYLAAHRYTDAGLEVRAAWERTWDLQRREDAGEKVGDIPVPPKYGQKDYRSPSYWRLRGKLDVPKERFISYPGCESDEDSQPIYGWAGWDHAQRAQALVTLYQDRKTREAWPPARLLPILAGLQELLPWLKQWHDTPLPDYDTTAYQAYAAFLEAELRAGGMTEEDLAEWRPGSVRG